ncbi:unnamed protein product [Calicophoron daubneyi]|uniref:Ubiquitin carboxyl-terminal hydrolase n=1 Tax=Calicophoron daubneyi TaxID=300641 RepID=A0AAV2T7T7_CALDB
MPVYKLNVKWQKERYKDVECNTDESPENFKAVLFSLTGVPPNRQKVMMPGKILGNTDYEGIKLKDGLTVMLIGTAEDLPKTEKMDISLEETVQAETKKVRVPYGLINLGNTCYMNAAVQMLYSVPELHAALELGAPHSSPSMDSRKGLCMYLKLLFLSLDKADKPVIPATFVACLRQVCPQFATRLPSDTEKDNQAGGLLSIIGGRFAQQDANECWTELMRAIQELMIEPAVIKEMPDILKNLSSNAPWNPIDRFFTGHLISKLVCTEATEEPPTETSETFTQLSCFINQDVKFLHTGIRNGFEGTVTKHSEHLQRDAVFKKTSVLTRLPAYLSIHFVRFFYKEDKHLNAKILKDVKFPLDLDLFEFCSDELQKKLLPVRSKMREVEDREIQKLPKKDKNARSSKVEIEYPDPVKHPELYEPFSLADDFGSNNSGYYDLQGVISHQGRTSSSGHYVAWVKVEGNWMKFDDDVVTQVTSEDILKLSGGGDWHCAYVLLYGPRRLLKLPPENTQETTSNAEATTTEAAKPLKGDHGVS